MLLYGRNQYNTVNGILTKNENKKKRQIYYRSLRDKLRGRAEVAEKVRRVSNG